MSKDPNSFAESTVDATIWLIAWHPEQLKEWLERHPPGDELYRVACSRMKNPPKERLA